MLQYRHEVPLKCSLLSYAESADKVISNWTGNSKSSKILKIDIMCREIHMSTNVYWRLHTHTHTFNGPFSGTTRVSRYQKGKTNLDFTEARDSEWQWHQLGHMQVCISLQTDNHASTPPSPDALPATQPTAWKHWRHLQHWRLLTEICDI